VECGVWYGDQQATDGPFRGRSKVLTARNEIFANYAPARTAPRPHGSKSINAGEDMKPTGGCSPSTSGRVKLCRRLRRRRVRIRSAVATKNGGE
jgi:hypothetical protein